MKVDPKEITTFPAKFLTLENLSFVSQELYKSIFNFRISNMGFSSLITSLVNQFHLKVMTNFLKIRMNIASHKIIQGKPRAVRWPRVT